MSRDIDLLLPGEQQAAGPCLLLKTLGSSGSPACVQANNRTDIICKHFLEAVEKRQYGWFWVCPNGGKDCKYRHALPPGYVLKSQMKV